MDKHFAVGRGAVLAPYQNKKNHSPLLIVKINISTIANFMSSLWMQTPLAELRSFVLSHLCNGQAVSRGGRGGGASPISKQKKSFSPAHSQD